MSQQMEILEYLKKNKTMTPMDAVVHMGCLKLATRISELKRLGYDIETVMESHVNATGQTKRYARYFYHG